MQRGARVAEGLLHENERQDSKKAVGYLFLEGRDVAGQLL